MRKNHYFTQAFIAAIALGVTIFGASASALSHGVPTMAFFEYSSPTVIIASAASFVALLGAFDRIKIALFRSAVSAVAKRTMSIYFMHLLLVQVSFSHSQQMMYSNHVWSLYLAACAAALAISTVVAICMQKVPVLRIMSD
ncbi:hypothetical protein [Paraburkholderia sp. RL18-085-BIA-A]|uniref:hypothetical protein n=1 Tax=Paraburkholderia sp. RL18-085-BIA-A TaxID=3031633 RepID=UPI0038B76722